MIKHPAFRPEQSVTPLAKFHQWCAKTLLPFWLENGIDHQKGGFFEQLHLDGQPDRSCLRRLRVTSRQIYALSHGDYLGWLQAQRQILNAVDYLLDRGWASNAEPGFLHLIDDDSRPADQRRDLYDHAFHILGLSWAYRATGDAQVRNVAQQTLDFVEEALAAKNGGWHEDLQHSQPRRQNPHMHMFEALLALYEATGETAHLRRADEIADLLFEKFMDRKSGQLFEFFDANWQTQAPRVVEPGHMAEWSWLLYRRKKISTGDFDASPAKHFLQQAETIGRQNNGFLIDQCQPDGAIEKDSFRLWGQTEWLKALLAQPNRHSEQSQLITRIFEQYLNQTNPAVWIDAVNADLQPICDRVPASIVYHLVSAAAEIDQISKPKKETPCPNP